ncbi:MAG: histidine--tRNA ligase, partial [Anaerolineaceae bacterium]|nr:histidine--tRNA ligase [Anaerolineaceae bacterium]
YPQEMAVRAWLYQVIREVSESFGYQEYDGPFLEKLELYAAKSGEELVKEQAFVFEDRGGDRVTLRPELTPTLARMVAERQRQLTTPLRWWSFGPFWRYERPQKGRTREFFQWNIDLIGCNTPEADAELVAVCAAFFKRVGLSPNQVQVLVNNRKLMEAVLAEMGVPQERWGDVFRLIDRRDKLDTADWEAYAVQIGLDGGQIERLKAALADPELWRKHPDFIRFFTVLEGMGYREYVRFDPQIIRGLDYYTGMVFEARDCQGGRAILGGGHYDNLVSDVGGDPLPGVGFAMGDVMTGIILQREALITAETNLADTVLVTVFDEERLATSFALAAELRAAGLKVVCYPEAAKLSKQLKFADRMGMQVAAIIGPEEAAGNLVTLKHLAARSQQTLCRSEVAAAARQMLLAC